MAIDKSHPSAGPDGRRTWPPLRVATAAVLVIIGVLTGLTIYYRGQAHEHADSLIELRQKFQYQCRRSIYEVGKGRSASADPSLLGRELAERFSVLMPLMHECTGADALSPLFERMSSEMRDLKTKDAYLRLWEDLANQYKRAVYCGPWFGPADCASADERSLDRP